LAIASQSSLIHRFDMRGSKRYTTYLRVRKWTDKTLSAHLSTQQSVALTPAYLLLFPFIVLEWATSGAAPDVLWLFPIPLTLTWVGFVSWRAGRLGKAASIRSARYYDQRGKFLLPPEYGKSESSLAAARRERREWSHRRAVKRHDP
jgi:hypothetical protein